MTRIFNLFGPSPIKPIQQHMGTVVHCAKLLVPFFENVLEKNWEEAAKLHKKIAALEKEADILKRELRLHLPIGLFLPVSRTDLLELLSAQDRIANTAKNIAGLIIGRKMIIPSKLASFVIPFLSCSLAATKQAFKAIDELDELLESGFRGNEVKIVEEMIVTLDGIEHESDDKLAEIQHHIFALEKKLPAIDVIFLYKLVKWIAELADHAQTIGGRLQILIAR